MQALIAIFHEVRDPRDFNARHDLAALLFIALAATLCGAKTCVDIADFAAANEAELAQIVDLPHGAPSHDSFSRLFRLLDPEEMTEAFARFQTALRAELGLPPAKGVVAVDGKSLRRGYERGRSFMPPLMISVWDAETRLSLASRHAPGGDEVAATLAALKAVTLKGCIVTADALHCHPRMASQIRAQGGHYALKLKGNHGPLFACALKAFAEADAKGKLPFYEKVENGHDRWERRHACVIALPSDAPAFPGLVALGRIESERRQGDGKPTRWVPKVGIPGAPVGLQARDVTIAQALKPMGYATGQFGKNHLGDRNEFLPTVHGFDEFFGNLYHLNAEEEPERPYWPKDDKDYVDNNSPRGVLRARATDVDDPTVQPHWGRVGKQTIADTGPLTRKRMETIDDETTAAAIDYMGRQVHAQKPFFVWMNTTRMHVFTHVRESMRGQSGMPGNEYADGSAPRTH